MPRLSVYTSEFGSVSWLITRLGTAGKLGAKHVVTNNIWHLFGTNLLLQLVNSSVTIINDIAASKQLGIFRILDVCACFLSLLLENDQNSNRFITQIQSLACFLLGHKRTTWTRVKTKGWDFSGSQTLAHFNQPKHDHKYRQTLGQKAKHRKVLVLS